jgi:DNA-binding XRE family transcriptional regulator
VTAHRRAKTVQDVKPFRLRSYRAGGAAEALLSLPERFKATREAHGLSQRTVGQRIGVGHAELSRFENREANPTAGVLLRIALWIDDQPPPCWQPTIEPGPYAATPYVIPMERRRRGGLG